jgi:hypothetical protein
VTAARLALRAAPLLLVARIASAQDSTTAPDDPWERRPVCASAFLKADWELNGKQRVCDWFANGVLSVGGLVGANVGAVTSVVMDQEAERGDPYLKRLGRRAAQNAFKATGAFAGAWLAGEDPRRRPPYLALKGPRPTGVLARTGRALGENLMAYRCDDPCVDASHVRRRVSVGRLLGAAASGLGGELLIHDRPNSVSRAARASLSAYALGYANAVIGEFTPELTAGVARSIGALFRGL